MLYDDNVKSATSPRSMRAVVSEWIEQHITTLHGNVSANALLLLAEQVDVLDEGEMNQKQYADTMRALLKEISAKQSDILSDIGATATAGIRQWGSCSGIWMGMLPFDLLSDTLKEQVVEHLETVHGIERSVFERKDIEI